jgi:hypothetical protein
MRANNDEIIRDVIGAKAPQIFFVQTVRAREAIVEGLNTARKDEQAKASKLIEVIELLLIAYPPQPDNYYDDWLKLKTDSEKAVFDYKKAIA